MLETQTPRLHRRLTGDDVVLDFPVLSEFRAAGLTEWLALMRGFGWGEGRQETRLSRRRAVLGHRSPQGWSAAERGVIERSRTRWRWPRGAAARRRHPRRPRHLSRPGCRRALVGGHIRRGSVGRLATFILCADLRGFTDFAEVTAPEEVTRRLNGYFDCMGAAIDAAGGEILKFLGDGILAAFLPPAVSDKPAVAAATLAAAQDILARVDRLNVAEAAAGNPALALDIALHEGEVTYGNVGTAERLDFTAIGPVINQATRIESQGARPQSPDLRFLRPRRPGPAPAAALARAASPARRARRAGSVHDHIRMRDGTWERLPRLCHGPLLQFRYARTNVSQFIPQRRGTHDPQHPFPRCFRRLFAAVMAVAAVPAPLARGKILAPARPMRPLSRFRRWQHSERCSRRRRRCRFGRRSRGQRRRGRRRQCGRRGGRPDPAQGWQYRGRRRRGRRQHRQEEPGPRG